MTTSKSLLRTNALSQRKNLSEDSRRAYSLKIENRLFEYLKDFQSSNVHLLTYRATPEEVDTSALFKTFTGHLYAPCVHDSKDMHWLNIDNDTHWVHGAFGILEPTNGHHWNPEHQPTILLCPLVGFDRAGNRLGMGKGCFDRWLATYQSHMHAIIGLAFSCQEVPNIPSEPHDIAMHSIITEKEIISCQTIPR